MSFAFPWILLALAALPGLWWLLKAVPPPPKSMIFPPLRLLLGLKSRRDEPDHMPWWILALRLMIASSLIAAAAGPILFAHPNAAQTTGPLLIAFDDDWSVATDWQTRLQWMEDRLNEAKRVGRPIYLVPTAPPVPQALGPMSAEQALTQIRHWKPKPWETDRQGVIAALKDVSDPAGIQSVWLANGLDDEANEAFIHALARLGNGPTVILGKTGAALSPAASVSESISVEINSLTPDPVAVVALGQDGRELGRALSDATRRASVPLPLALRNQVARIVIEGEHSAAATVLMDERNRRRTVALVQDGMDESRQPLLESLTYVAKAVQPFAEIVTGPQTELLAQKPSVLMLSGSLSQDRAFDLGGWIETGGMVVRFADETMAQNDHEPLLPTRLRGGGREMGGVLSWTEPQTMAAFSAESPFAGLTVPEEIQVRSQVLADPNLDPDAKVWARLADSTPLVTAKAMGQGWLVLFHCAATPKWSNLSLSGLFPDMLHRLVMMASAHQVQGEGPFAPVRVMDGFGLLFPPTGTERALTEQSRPGPAHPPGFYGDSKAPRAFNLGPALKPLRRFVPPASVRVEQMGMQQAERDLRPFLVGLALVLGLADLVITARLTHVAVAVAMLLTIGGALAEEVWKAGLDTRLAYVETGVSRIDSKSRLGLGALTEVLAARSTTSLAAPQGVRLDGGDLAFYPLLYWPVTAEAETLSETQAQAVRHYLKRGGLILLDRQDGDVADPALEATLRRLSRQLDLPPLTPLSSDHVLNRSFYLLRGLPGRFADGKVWIQADTADNDGVATVILGSNDWAGEWAGMGVPGQQEAAFRFGINLCLYALTGNYKADQVHLPAILERLGHQP